MRPIFGLSGLAIVLLAAGMVDQAMAAEGE